MPFLWPMKFRDFLFPKVDSGSFWQKLRERQRNFIEFFLSFLTLEKHEKKVFIKTYFTFAYCNILFLISAPKTERTERWSEELAQKRFLARAKVFNYRQESSLLVGF
jgi:hypothetical protein